MHGAPTLLCVLGAFFIGEGIVRTIHKCMGCGGLDCSDCSRWTQGSIPSPVSSQADAMLTGREEAAANSGTMRWTHRAPDLLSRLKDFCVLPLPDSSLVQCQVAPWVDHTRRLPSGMTERGVTVPSYCRRRRVQGQGAALHCIILS